MSRVAWVVGYSLLIGACAEKAPAPEEPRSESLASCPPGAELRGAAPPEGRAIWCERDGKMHGPFVRFFESGEVEALGTYGRNRRIGPWRRFHRDGAVARSGTFREGERHGTWHWFSRSGRKEREVHYERGRPTVAYDYDAQGRSRATTYFEDGSPVEKIGIDEEGHIEVRDFRARSACERLAAKRFQPAPGRDAPAELALLVLVDGTGAAVEPLAPVRDLLQALSGSLRADDLIGLYLFGEEVVPGIPLAPLARRSFGPSLTGFKDPGQTADECRALHEARRRLARADARSRHILLLAYGEPTTGARAMARAIREAGQHLHVVDVSALRPGLATIGGPELEAIAETAGGSLFSGADPVALARELLTRGLCSRSAAGTCVRLGLRHLRGDGADKDPELGHRLLRLGCEHGDAWGCARLGDTLLAEGKPKEAARALRAGCEKGSGYACWQLGKLHEDGRGAPRDPGRARALFRRGCMLGSSSACADDGR